MWRSRCPSPAGGLLAGLDRKLTARLQSRMGPPLLQPFYDVLKLCGKSPCVRQPPWLVFCSFVCVTASALALFLFYMQGDLLLAFLRHDHQRPCSRWPAR